MPSLLLGKRKRESKHPYLAGNFAPVQQTCTLTPCSYTGEIPTELAGGQYVRNGGNPVSNEDLGRDAHWFDGDGMLSGVSFKRCSDQPNSAIQPEFVNQFILTDLYLAATTLPALRKPITPSITTLISPLTSLFKLILSITRTILLVFLSYLPGSKQAIKKISVANTAVIYHDGRALATCESGPPIRVALPSLKTVGWFDGNKVENELQRPSDAIPQAFGGGGLFHFMKEWTTAHPKVDPVTNEMMLFHSFFLPPYVNYSVIPAEKYDSNSAKVSSYHSSLVNKPVAGISSAKMMHDFGVSHKHTVIMDLPLSMDPLQVVKGRPPISYDATKPSRFGVFPRHEPSNVHWFETDACCIFHTANTWDVHNEHGQLESVDMLACRMTSAAFVFSAGNITMPVPTTAIAAKVAYGTTEKDTAGISSSGPVSTRYEQDLDLERAAEISETAPLLGHAGQTEPLEPGDCRLYYYSFPLGHQDTTSPLKIAHQFALSRVPFEFPSVSPKVQMSEARYIYGCTTIDSSFDAALGRSAKIDGLVKMDAKSLIARGKASNTPTTGCVDERTARQIIQDTETRSTGIDPASSETQPIQIFRAPPGWYLQEPRFVPRSSQDQAKSLEEDDGFLVTYAFNEAQLDQTTGEAPLNACSELWIIDARDMSSIVARVYLPQRVPYGMHGGWFNEEQVLGQRPILRTRNDMVSRTKNDIRGGERQDSDNNGFGASTNGSAPIALEKDSRSQRLGRWFIGKVIGVIGG